MFCFLFCLFICIVFYFLFYFLYICISFSIFVILVDVFFSFFVSFSNMSFVVILVEGSYLPLKVFFTSNILVLALNIIDASWRVKSFMYLGRSPTFHLVFFSKYCVFVFPSIFFLKKLFSWLEFISPVFISCVVLFFVGSIFPSIFCIKFHYFAG